MRISRHVIRYFRSYFLRKYVTGKGILTAAYGNKERKGILRAGYGS